MRTGIEIELEIDRLVSEMDRVDKALDGFVDHDTGEVVDGALDVLARAEDAWVEHKDAKVSDLAVTYDGRQLPGDDKVSALTREASPEARRAWDTYLHAKRLVRRLRERGERLAVQLTGRQTQVKLVHAEHTAGQRESQGSLRGLPQHAQRRGAA